MPSSVRLARLVTSCIVLGIGVAMLLLAALGSDGYSTLVNGASIALGVSFLVVNCVLGLLLLALAWWRGVTPGAGTLVQPLVVGTTVSACLALVDTPQPIAVLLVLAFPVLAVGVAGYLGSGGQRGGGGEAVRLEDGVAGQPRGPAVGDAAVRRDARRRAERVSGVDDRVTQPAEPGAPGPEPALPRPRRWPSILPCRSAGAIRPSRVAARSGAGCSVRRSDPAPCW
jgi:hypothetical protein